MNKLDIKILILPHYDLDFGHPEYETHGAAGFDIRAQIGKNEKVELLPGQKILVPTGICFEIPEGYEMQIRPRSGLSFKTNLMVINSPGTIDSDYRGELKILLGNMGKKTEVIEHGHRIAQGVFSPVYRANFLSEGSLSETSRGAGGFGSTGKI